MAFAIAMLLQNNFSACSISNIDCAAIEFAIAIALTSSFCFAIVNYLHCIALQCIVLSLKYCNCIEFPLFVKQQHKAAGAAVMSEHSRSCMHLNLSHPHSHHHYSRHNLCDHCNCRNNSCVVIIAVIICINCVSPPPFVDCLYLSCYWCWCNSQNSCWQCCCCCCRGCWPCCCWCCCCCCRGCCCSRFRSSQTPVFSSEAVALVLLKAKAESRKLSFLSLRRTESD